MQQSVSLTSHEWKRRAQWLCSIMAHSSVMLCWWRRVSHHCFLVGKFLVQTNENHCALNWFCQSKMLFSYFNILQRSRVHGYIAWFIRWDYQSLVPCLLVIHLKSLKGKIIVISAWAHPREICHARTHSQTKEPYSFCRPIYQAELPISKSRYLLTHNSSANRSFYASKCHKQNKSVLILVLIYVTLWYFLWNLFWDQAKQCWQCGVLPCTTYW